MRLVRGLTQASHPLPCLAVTAFVVAWGAVAVELALDELAVLAAAVYTGQLSVGWSNDWLDAPRDIAAGRVDKPVAVGLVGRRAVGVAAVVALGLCVVTSALLGAAAGAVNLFTVLLAWGYNVGLKGSVVSPLTYAAFFGLLPAVATLAADPPTWPPASVVVGAALLGVGAHFANTVGDVAADEATAVRGLPQRLGPRPSLLVMVGCVAGAALVLLAGAAQPGVGGVLLLAAGAVLAVGAAGLHWWRPSGATAFRLTLAAAGLVVAGFLVSG